MTTSPHNTKNGRDGRTDTLASFVSASPAQPDLGVVGIHASFKEQSMKFTTIHDLWEINPNSFRQGMERSGEKEHRVWAAICAEAVRQKQAKVLIRISQLSEEIDVAQEDIFLILAKLEQSHWVSRISTSQLC